MLTHQFIKTTLPIEPQRHRHLSRGTWLQTHASKFAPSRGEHVACAHPCFVIPNTDRLRTGRHRHFVRDRTRFSHALERKIPLLLGQRRTRHGRKCDGSLDDTRQGCCLDERDVLNVFSKVTPRRRTHTRASVTEINPIHVMRENLIFAAFPLDAHGQEDLL